MNMLCCIFIVRINLILGLELYKTGMSMLNATRPNKSDAYLLLVKASELGNKDAMVMVAWARLLGSYLPQDIEKAKASFEQLADVGVPDGHMVCKMYYFYNIF